MIFSVRSPMGLGVLVSFLPVVPSHQPNRSKLPANDSKFGQYEILFCFCRKTYVCFSPSGDGWFQGLLATEKKRPCKKHYLSCLRKDQNKRPKSRQRASMSIWHGAYVRVQMDCGESCLIDKTPSLLRVSRNRRRTFTLP